MTLPDRCALPFKPWRAAWGQAQDEPGDHYGRATELGRGRGAEAYQDRGGDGADRDHAGEKPRPVGAEPGSASYQRTKAPALTTVPR
jgi:hypothetical protein